MRKPVTPCDGFLLFKKIYNFEFLKNIFFIQRFAKLGFDKIFDKIFDKMKPEKGVKTGQKTHISLLICLVSEKSKMPKSLVFQGISAL